MCVERLPLKQSTPAVHFEYNKQFPRGWPTPWPHATPAYTISFERQLILSSQSTLVMARVSLGNHVTMSSSARIICHLLNFMLCDIRIVLRTLNERKRNQISPRQLHSVGHLNKDTFNDDDCPWNYDGWINVREKKSKKKEKKNSGEHNNTEKIVCKTH